ncbi:hypothetical protein BESB_027690 [Besnoitia besnoiti]|uniref:Uncharacterized protein n=1 Tax=Besnoitia besnoiti TaxID=94643 RepID=A0A2A9M271_BESBE|nr:uncharacterized protein BESB_027690 [Besnoitia besnoiti]PFH31334.1 hypothetical protein BESB_027690 [Besnoitia besnoiti]
MEAGQESFRLETKNGAASHCSDRRSLSASACVLDETGSSEREAERASELSVITRALRKPLTSSYCCHDFRGVLCFIPKDIEDSDLRDPTSSGGSVSPRTPEISSSSVASSRSSSSNASAKLADKQRRWSYLPTARGHDIVNSTANAGAWKRLESVPSSNEAPSTLDSYIPCLFYRWPASDLVLVHVHGLDEDLGVVAPMLRTVHQRLQLNVLAMEFPGYGVCTPVDSAAPTPSVANKGSIDGGSPCSMPPNVHSASNKESASADAASQDKDHVQPGSTGVTISGADDGKDNRVDMRKRRESSGGESDEDKTLSSAVATACDGDNAKLLVSLRCLLSFVLRQLRVPPQRVFFSANKLAAGPVIELCSFADLFFNGNNSFGGLILIEPLLVPELGTQNSSGGGLESQVFSDLSLPFKFTLNSQQGSRGERGSDVVVPETFTLLSSLPGGSSGDPSPSVSTSETDVSCSSASFQTTSFPEATLLPRVGVASSLRQESPKTAVEGNVGGTISGTDCPDVSAVERSLPRKSHDPSFPRRVSCTDSVESSLSHKAGKLSRATLGLTRDAAPPSCDRVPEEERQGDTAGCGGAEGRDRAPPGRCSGMQPIFSRCNEGAAGGVQKHMQPDHPAGAEVEATAGAGSAASQSSCRPETGSRQVEQHRGDCSMHSDESKQYAGLSKGTTASGLSFPSEAPTDLVARRKDLLPEDSGGRSESRYSGNPQWAVDEACKPVFTEVPGKNGSCQKDRNLASRRSPTDAANVSTDPVASADAQVASAKQGLARKLGHEGISSEETAFTEGCLKDADTSRQGQETQRTSADETNFIESAAERAEVADATSGRHTACGGTDSAVPCHQESAVDSLSRGYTQHEEESGASTFFSFLTSTVSGSSSGHSTEWEDGRSSNPFLSTLTRLLSGSLVGEGGPQLEEGGRAAAIAQAALEERRKLTLAKDKKIVQKLPAAFGIKQAIAHIREVSCPLLFMKRELYLHMKPHLGNATRCSTAARGASIAVEDGGSSSEDLASDALSKSFSDMDEDYDVFSEDVSSVTSDSSAESTYEDEGLDKTVKGENEDSRWKVFGGGWLRSSAQQSSHVARRKSTEQHIVRESKIEQRRLRQQIRQTKIERMRAREREREARKRATAYLETMSPREKQELEQEEASSSRVIKLLSEMAGSPDKETGVFDFFEEEFYQKLGSFISEALSHHAAAGELDIRGRHSLTPESAADFFSRRATQHMMDKARGVCGRRRSSGGHVDGPQGVCVPLHMFDVPLPYRQRDALAKQSQSKEVSEGKSWIERAFNAYTSYFDLLGSASTVE